MEEPPRYCPAPLMSTQELSLYSLRQRRPHLTEAPGQSSLLFREMSVKAGPDFANKMFP